MSPQHAPVFERFGAMHCSVCGRIATFVLSYFKWDFEFNTWRPCGYWRHRPKGRV
jgi:hypothetical protein